MTVFERVIAEFLYKTSKTYYFPKWKKLMYKR